jgi:hypothetical protein
MGICPHSDLSNWLPTGLGYWFFPLCGTDKCCVCYGEFTLSICCFDFVCYVCRLNYFIMLISVFNFTSFLVFCALHYRCSLDKWQLPVTLQCTTLKSWYHVFSHSKKMQATGKLPQCALANQATDTFGGSFGLCN